MTSPITVFYVYAQADEELRQQLEKHLALLRRQGVIAGWQKIQAGTPWAEKTEQVFNEAKLILLLVSADFLDSDVCYEQQMQRALEREHQGEVKVVPILSRPVDWKSAPFAHLQVLPKNEKPITSWLNRDEAFEEVAKDIRCLIEGIPLPLYSRVDSKPNQQEEILFTYDQAIQFNPNSAAAYREKGSALDDLKRYEEALLAFDQAIKLDPKDAETYYYKGVTLYNLNHYKKALLAFDRAIKLDPNFMHSYSFKGMIFDALKRYEEALLAYDQAIKLDHSDAVTYYCKGMTLNALKRYEEALLAYDQAIKLNPNYAVTYYSKGMTLNALERYEEAQIAFEKARQLGF